MNLPSVASCDSARAHPPFLASSRPPQNLRNEPWLFYDVKQINSIRKSSISVPFHGGTPLDLYFLSEIHLLDVSHSRRTNLDVYRIRGCSASILPHIIQLFQNPMREVSHFRRSHLRMTCLPFASQNAPFPTSRAGRLAFSEDLYRFLSHLRMPCFNFALYYSLIAASYRPVHVIRISTRKILALRGLCAYRVFDPLFVSCWPMFVDLSVVRRRSARCLLKMCSRLRETQNRIQNIDNSRVIRSSLAAALNATAVYYLHHFSSDYIMFFMFSVIFARPMIFGSFLKPAFSLETSEICVEIDTVYLLFYDLNLIPFRRIRAFIRYVRTN